MLGRLEISELASATGEKKCTSPPCESGEWRGRSPNTVGNLDKNVFEKLVSTVICDYT